LQKGTAIFSPNFQVSILETNPMPFWLVNRGHPPAAISGGGCVRGGSVDQPYTTAETSQQLARCLHLIQLIRCLNLPCQAEKGDAGIKCFNKAVPVSMYALNICVYKIFTWIWMCDMSINKYFFPGASNGLP